jgi:hypothetical protein
MLKRWSAFTLFLDDAALLVSSRRTQEDHSRI